MCVFLFLTLNVRSWSFSSKQKLLSEISRRPEHIAISIGYVKKVYDRANL